jgi:hypothetical protein
MDYTRVINTSRYDKDLLIREITTAIRKPDAYENLVGGQVKVTFDTALSQAEEDTLYLVIDIHLHTQQPKFIGYKVEHTTDDDWHYLDVSKPYGYYIQRARYFDSISGFTTGTDKARFCISPDTIIGAIGANVAINDTVITVSSTVLENINLGNLVRLTDGTNTEEYKEVISLDKANSTITLESGTVNAFSAASPTYVQFMIEMVGDFWLGAADGVVPLEGGEKATFIPANTTIRIAFFKAGTETKYLFIQLEEFI